MNNSRIIVVQSAKGGVGASVITSNLAITLGYITKKPVLLTEFDTIHGGSQVSLLNIDIKTAKFKNINKFLNSGKITQNTLLDNIIKHKTGIYLLSSETTEELESLSTLDVINILSIAGSYFENIVVDLSQPYISEELITSFDFASVVCLVMTPDIVCYEHTQKFLELMNDLNFSSSKFELILNMTGVSSTEIDADSIKEHLGKDILGSIPYDNNSFVSSVNLGIPIMQNASSFFSNQSGTLSSLIKLPNNLNQELVKSFYNISKKLLNVETTNIEKAKLSAIEIAKQFISDEENKSKAKENKVINEEKIKPKKNNYSINLDLLKEIKSTVHTKIVNEMRLDVLSNIDLNNPEKKAELKEKIINKITDIFNQENYPITDRLERKSIIIDIANEALGLGPLEELLEDTEITEIMVNGIDKIYVEKSGKLELINKTFTDERQLRVIIDRIVAPIGRRVDESSPYVDARLPDGSRVNIIIPPLAIDGPSITIRKFPEKRLVMEDFIKYNTLTPEMAEFLASCVNAKMNIFISGSTGSGKTTLLNILSSYIPNDERIVTIEDAAELRLHQEHVVRLESRPPNIEGKGAVTIRDLVKNSLRMRPDRIVIGEVRGGEALDMLQAMNTGHEGSLATGHANSPRDALSRIETMVMMAGVDLPIRAIREQITSAINIIVQQNRMRDGSRKITKIVEITGMEGDIISTQDIFSFESKGIDQNGKIIGSFICTKIRPKVLDIFESRGVKIPSIFEPDNIISRMKQK